MDNPLALEIIKLLASLESWGFSANSLPDHTLEKLNEITEILTAIVKEDGSQV